MGWRTSGSDARDGCGCGMVARTPRRCPPAPSVTGRRDERAHRADRHAGAPRGGGRRPPTGPVLARPAARGGRRRGRPGDEVGGRARPGRRGLHGEQRREPRRPEVPRLGGGQRRCRRGARPGRSRPARRAAHDHRPPCPRATPGRPGALHGRVGEQPARPARRLLPDGAGPAPAWRRRPSRARQRERRRPGDPCRDGGPRGDRGDPRRRWTPRRAPPRPCHGPPCPPDVEARGRRHGRRGRRAVGRRCRAGGRTQVRPRGRRRRHRVREPGWGAAPGLPPPRRNARLPSPRPCTGRRTRAR